MAPKLFKNWWLLGLKGLMLFGLGLFALFNPGTAAGVLVTYLGIAGILAGIAEIALAFSNREREEWGSYLGEGVLDLLVGIVFLTRPEVVNILPILLGVWILFTGASLLMRGLRGRAEGSYLVPGILMLVLGFLLISNPFGAYVSILIVLGIALLLLGLSLMFVSWKLRGLGKKVGRAAEAVAGRLQNRP